MEHAKHIIRAVLLLVLAAVVFIVVRHFAIPDTFGEYGPYRFASVDEFADQAPIHAARGACASDCHQHGAQAEALAKGKHKGVSCEVCHGPLAGHPTDKQPSMTANRSSKVCAWCHEATAGRPKSFPQVVLREHVTAAGVELNKTGDGLDDAAGRGICLECHDDPHNPGP